MPISCVLVNNEYMGTKNVKYTKDKLMDIIFENQEVISNQVERNITAFNEMKNALQQINDDNKLHRAKDNDRDQTLKSLVQSNNRFYKIFSYLLLILVTALVVLAGAEKALKFIPTL